MSPHDDLERRLVAALHRQAAQAPDVEEVRRAAAATGARRQRRRRRAGAGAALAVVGLGALAVPLADDALRSGRPDGTLVGTGPATAGTPTAAPRPVPVADPLPWTVPGDGQPPAPVEDPDPAQYQAYFEAGYDYEDAEGLAEIWGRPGDVDYAKAAAGAELIAGDELPFRPGYDPGSFLPTQNSNRFVNNGYGVEQALALARLWQLPSGYQAVQKAGRMLRYDEPLPMGPSEPGVPSAAMERAATAFHDAGYDPSDAEELAELWWLADADDAVHAAGANILRGEDLPLDP